MSGVLVTRAAMDGVSQLSIVNGQYQLTANPAIPLLGDHNLAKLPLYPKPGAKLIYVDTHALGRAGIAPPPHGAVTPEYRYMLQRRFGRATDGAATHSAVVGRPDRYTSMEAAKGLREAIEAGEDVHYRMGAGRGHHDPDHGIYLKGGGPTVYAVGDGHHNSGTTNVRQSVLEVVAPHILENLTELPVPVGALIVGLGEGTKVVEEATRTEPRSVMGRVGLMVRPAHLTELSAMAARQHHIVHEILAPLVGDDLQRNVAASGTTMELELPEVVGGNVRPMDFFKVAHARGLLEWQTGPDGEDIVDMRATTQNFVRLIAQSTARNFRWGIVHGAPSSGNYQVDGAPLDNLTAATAIRRGTVRLTYPNGLYFGEKGENHAIASATWAMLQSVRVNLSEDERRAYGVPESLRDYWEFFEEFFVPAYNRALSVEMLRATGMKRDLAQHIDDTERGLTEEFWRVLHHLATMENEGPLPQAVNPDYTIRMTPEEIASKSTVDVFNGLLHDYARIYWTDRGRATVETAIELLQPIYTFQGNNDGEVERRSRVRQYATRFVALFDQIMQVAQGAAADYYDNPDHLAHAMIHRAEFENRPVGMHSWLWRNQLAELALGEQVALESAATLEGILTSDAGAWLAPAARQAIEGVAQGAYALTGNSPFEDPRFVTRFVHERAEPALRSTSALLTRGEFRQHQDGRKNDEVEVIERDGITYSIEVDPQTGKRQLSIRLHRNVAQYSMALAPLGVESDKSVGNVRLEYRLGEGQDVTTIEMGEDSDADTIAFKIDVETYQAGLFTGRVVVDGPEGEISEGIYPYAFYVPDNKDLESLTPVSRPA